MFLLDRQSVDDVKHSTFLYSYDYRIAIESLLDYAGVDRNDFWFTPIVSCPTLIMPTDKKAMVPEVTPLPKDAEVAACSGRVHQEAHIISPEIIVAMGQLAAKVFIHKGGPTIHYNLGDTVEGHIRGDLVEYPVPVLLTYSLHALLVAPDFTENGPWHKVGQHIHTAVHIAKQLRG
jgi:uracil-DNA glycosylase family 4